MKATGSCFAMFGLLLFACLAQAQQHAESGRTARFRHIVQQLQVNSQADFERYTPQFRDKLTGQVRTLLAQQLIESLNRHGPDVAMLRDKMRALDPGLYEEKEFTNAPYAMSVKLQETPAVITAYLLRRGGAGAPEFKSIIQAYRHGPTGWTWVAETGGALDHHALIIVKLPARHAGEACFIAHGNLSGFNGRKHRIRAYCFDGEKFNTIWSPPDRLSPELTVNGAKINLKSIDEHQYYELRKPPYTRVEQFALTPSGVIRLSTRLANQ
jgi:hypothetical protein